eukprot:Awhi_evm1s10566
MSAGLFHSQAYGNMSLKPFHRWWTNHKIVTDQARRQLFRKHEDSRAFYKCISLNENIPERYRWNAAYKLHALPRNSLRSRIRNRSTQSGRARYVLSDW